MASTDLLNTFTQLVEFTVEAPDHHDLVAALIARDKHFTCSFPGFISASVQASDDGERVLHQVSWRSRPQCEQAGAAHVTPDMDLYELMRRHRVKRANFNSFQVVGQTTMQC